MRACYVLLVAATSLLAASDAAISAASVQSTLSKVVAPDVAQPIQAEQAAASSTLRFLRSHNILDDDEEDVDSLDDVYEERGKPPFATKRLDKALDDIGKLGKLCKQWDDNGYSLKDVAKNVGVDLNGGMGQKYFNLVSGFQAYKGGWRPQ
ncbi:hypothetical protein PR003_g33117 [Phytophthora rubi]|uniref:RxLR effector protein n=1 Tax=Phytophthora rubi TaxID=129364 RepID=A0A6A3GFC4_9STRA|nr:hypothetical protein PR001_g32076 [Phytophthora rubi]KAE8955582.1 hypothetical protein PR002_g31746 [Phytophthora rubi]KAE9263562.1 hypothetical protein PR003_g33117 [Phytophthora rubi]